MSSAPASSTPAAFPRGGLLLASAWRRLLWAALAGAGLAALLAWAVWPVAV